MFLAKTQGPPRKAWQFRGSREAGMALSGEGISAFLGSGWGTKMGSFRKKRSPGELWRLRHAARRSSCHSTGYNDGFRRQTQRCSLSAFECCELRLPGALTSKTDSLNDLSSRVGVGGV